MRARVLERRSSAERRVQRGDEYPTQLCGSHPSRFVAASVVNRPVSAPWLRQAPRSVRQNRNVQGA